MEENKDLVSEYDTVEAWWMEQEQERVAKKIQAKSAELQNVEPQTGGGEDQVASTIITPDMRVGELLPWSNAKFTH